MSTKKRLTKKELEVGLASGQITYRDPKSKHRKGYEVRIASGFEVSNSYPGEQDHPSPEGSISYQRTVNTSDSATVWEAVQNEHYAQAGIPTWVRESLSDLDISVYWQVVHYQMQWGGRANMSFKTLSRNLGVKYRSIQRSVHRLLDIGAIELIHKHTGRRPSIYRVKLLSSLEEIEKVEATSEYVEVTGESSKDDSSDTQKTNPLKGFVARTPAQAGRATPHRKKSVGLLTIDEQRKLRAKSIASKEVAAKSKLTRSFFPNEANKKRIEEVLEIELLAKKWQAVKDVAKVSGCLDLDTESFIPAPLADEATLMRNVQESLTSNNKFDVRNLARAVELILDSYLRLLAPKQKELETRLVSYQHQKRREAEIEAAKQKELDEINETKKRVETERLEAQRKRHKENFQYLEKARELLSLLYPEIHSSIDGWGGISPFLYELGNKELEKVENVDIRLTLQSLSENIPRKIKELRQRFYGSSESDPQSMEASLEQWIHGSDEWKGMAEPPC